jgi:hypothetical protein
MRSNPMPSIPSGGTSAAAHLLNVPSIPSIPSSSIREWDESTGRTGTAGTTRYSPIGTARNAWHARNGANSGLFSRSAWNGWSACLECAPGPPSNGHSRPDASAGRSLSQLRAWRPATIHAPRSGRPAPTHRIMNPVRAQTCGFSGVFLDILNRLSHDCPITGVARRVRGSHAALVVALPHCAVVTRRGSMPSRVATLSRRPIHV